MTEKQMVDLARGSIPIVLALSLMALVAASAYGVGSFVNSLVTDKQAAQEKFADINKELTSIRELIENGGFLRRGEFLQWCRNVELLNQGFKCGNTPQ